MLSKLHNCAISAHRITRKQVLGIGATDTNGISNYTSNSDGVAQPAAQISALQEIVIAAAMIGKVALTGTAKATATSSILQVLVARDTVIVMEVLVARDAVIVMVVVMFMRSFKANVKLMVTPMSYDS